MPRKKPTALKLLQGTYRPDRVKGEPKPRPLAPKPPRGLPKEARRWWRELAPKLEPLGLLTETDGPAFADYCLCLARLDAAERDIQERGLLVPGERGMVKNPSCQLAREYRAAVQKWAARFGLDPQSRTGLDVKGDEKEVDEFEEFLQRGKELQKRRNPV
jgi:P27 family predicted phage terminase small subunit